MRLIRIGIATETVVFGLNHFTTERIKFRHAEIQGRGMLGSFGTEPGLTLVSGRGVVSHMPSRFEDTSALKTDDHYLLSILAASLVEWDSAFRCVSSRNLRLIEAFFRGSKRDFLPVKDSGRRPPNVELIGLFLSPGRTQDCTPTHESQRPG
jgi:hypothetical protein